MDMTTNNYGKTGCNFYASLLPNLLGTDLLITRLIEVLHVHNFRHGVANIAP